jgi:hypothetical protein
VKFAEALLLAVLILGIIVIGGAIIVSAVSRKPRLERSLAEAAAERERLEALVQGIYATVAGARDADPLASFIAGEIEQSRAKKQ